MNSKKEPEIIEGGLSVDDRGQIIFANDFNFNNIKRFYLVENFSTDTVRAFHGHQKEEKYVLVISGSVIVALVEMDDIKNPNKNNKVSKFILSARKPVILHIPAGYANGFKSLEPETKIMFLSTATLEESKNDDYRFPVDYWGEGVWKIENR